jgi:gamma-glutamylcyclotransferase (GGCT)/AIG2-like uncharacterized protein YtfP
MHCLLFVYGNSKRDFSQHHLLQKSKFLGLGQTTSKYQLYQVSWFPALVETTTNPVSVYGELFEVSEESIFLLNSVYNLGQNFFRKEEIEVQDFSLVSFPLYLDTWEALNNKKAWTYIFAKSEKGHIPRGNFWSLDFCKG